MRPHLPPRWRDRRWTGRFWTGDITATMSSAKNDIYVNLTYHYYDEGLIMHGWDSTQWIDGGTGTVPDGQRSVGEIFEVILRK